MREVPKLMPYLHLPVQAGSDRVLKAMNRRHRRRTTCGWSSGSGRRGRTSRCRATSSSASRARPRPTSQATLALVEAVGYAQAFSFAYSARPGTPAAERPGSPSGKAERLQRLQAVLGAQQAAFQAAQVGRVLPVLVEKPGRLPGQMAGRSPYLNAVHLAGGAGLIGSVAGVRIVAAGPHALAGELAA